MKDPIKILSFWIVERHGKWFTAFLGGLAPQGPQEIDRGENQIADHWEHHEIFKQFYNFSGMG